jgi:3-isopropylmalate/(R)-2-methylmalate dehydratase small subunit
VNEITCVVAESYARIFRQNMFNGGMLAIELPADKIDEIFALKDKGNVECAVDAAGKKLTFTFAGGTKTIDFTLSQFDDALVKAGGWVEFADAKY